MDATTQHDMHTHLLLRDLLVVVNPGEFLPRHQLVRLLPSQQLLRLAVDRGERCFIIVAHFFNVVWFVVLYIYEGLVHVS